MNPIQSLKWSRIEQGWIPQAIDPPMHTGYRHIFNNWFTADAMSKLEPHLQQYAETLVDMMIQKPEHRAFKLGFGWKSGYRGYVNPLRGPRDGVTAGSSSSPSRT